MEDKFRLVEEEFSLLQNRFRQGKITQQEYIDSLRQLRFRDESGKFWMVGVWSGKWYYFDFALNDWVQAVPPSFSTKKSICIYCGFENDLETEYCARCGALRNNLFEAGTKVSDNIAKPGIREEISGHFIGDKPAAVEVSSLIKNHETTEKEINFIMIKSISLRSIFWLSAVAGIFIGFIIGLLVGITSFFPSFVAALPSFFTDIQGKLPGGIFFPLGGAVIGFMVSGGLGLILGAFINFVLSLTGGLKINADKTAFHHHP